MEQRAGLNLHNNSQSTLVCSPMALAVRFLCNGCIDCCKSSPQVREHAALKGASCLLAWNVTAGDDRRWCGEHSGERESKQSAEWQTSSKPAF